MRCMSPLILFDFTLICFDSRRELAVCDGPAAAPAVVGAAGETALPESIYPVNGGGSEGNALVMELFE